MERSRTPAHCPRPLETRDAEMLIGVLAVLESAIWDESLPEAVESRVLRRVVKAGLLENGAGERDLRQALDDLNQRLRYVLGEYEEPVTPMPVPPRVER